MKHLFKKKTLAVALVLSGMALTSFDAHAKYTFKLMLSGLKTTPVTSDSTSLDTLYFGNQTVGTTSSTQSVQLNNTGNTTLSISQIAASGNFAATQNCGSSLSVDGSCLVDVTFTPESMNTNTGTLSIVTNAGTQSVALTGIGLEVLLGVAPTSLSFGYVDTGSASAAQSFTLTNSGNTSATGIGAPVVQGQFTASSSCPTTLAAGGSCSVSVTFKPTGGSTTGTVTLPTSAGNATVSLSGYGLVYTCTPSGYWESVPVQTQQECDWSFVTTGTPAACTTSAYDCHGTSLTAPITSSGSQCTTGTDSIPEYETVTTYQQQWVSTTSCDWE
jgi:hypothetical protein